MYDKVQYRINKDAFLQTLSIWNGYLKKKVRIIACGGTALTLLNLKESTKDVDLIIADVNMPKMDGITMCSKIHASKEFEHIPLFVLTTQFEGMREKGKEAGIKIWIVKPFNPQKVLMIVKEMIPS